MQFYSGRGLCGILHHTNIACKECQSDVRDFLQHSPCQPLHMTRLTFVGSLGDAHSLPYELIVSSPSTPAHASWASEATMLTCRVAGCCGSPEIMFVPLMLCPQPGHPQISTSLSHLSWVRSLLHLLPKSQASPDSTLTTGSQVEQLRLPPTLISEL